MSRHLLLASILLVGACAEDVGKGHAAAEVKDVVEAPAATKAAAPAADAKLAISPANASIEALGAKVTATHPVIFKDFSGSAAVSGGTVSNIEFTIQMASLESDHPKLTGHLKHADFFDVETYPTSTFTSTEIKQGAEQEGFGYTVTGNFAIHGQTKQISFPANISVNGKNVSGDSVFVINRQDFGISYPGRPDDLIQDNVRMTIKFAGEAS